jgi:putative phosphoribosyl transferase
VGVPVAPLDTCEALAREVDEVVSVVTPDPFYGVGLWYEDFAQTSDKQVRELLARAAAHAGSG